MSNTSDDPDFDGWVETLSAQIEGALAELEPSERNRWLQSLHHDYTQRFTADNSRIFGSGAIMIPVSLAAFVVPVLAEDAGLLPLVVLGVGAIALMALWNLIADRYWAFQNAQRAWIVAVERTIGVTERPRPKVFPVHTARRALTWLVAIGWLVNWYDVWLVS